MKKKIYILSVLLVVILFTSAVPRTGVLDELFLRLKYYNSSNPEEKVYLQTDKTFYKHGENIWYKAFLLNSNDNKPSRLSDVLYVELHDPKGNIVYKKSHHLSEGTVDGFCTVSTVNPGGLYTLVAYTSWMKNQDQKTWFRKEINLQRVITPRLLLKLDFEKRAYGPGDEVTGLLSVSDLNNTKTNNSHVKAEVKLKGQTIQTLTATTKEGESRIVFRLPVDLDTSDGLLQVLVTDRGMQESISRSVPIVLNRIGLSFFPEGGDMVVGMPARVAFEALNEFNKGADVSGYITDEDSSVVARFESFHLGMGAFEFTPQVGKKYFAHIEKPYGKHLPVALPAALPAGYVISLTDNTEKELTFTVHAPETNTVNLVARVCGELQYNMWTKLNKGVNKVKIPLKDFPAGVAVFTLFDPAGNEACERLVYVNPHKNMTIRLQTDKDIYAPGEEVKLTVTTLDGDKRPIPANLGIAVVDEQLISFADDRQDNLLSYLLLSSELEGKIQEPSFYFNPDEPKAAAAIDYLMLTHGWRRFSWKDIAKFEAKPHQYPAEKIADIYGYVRDMERNPVQTTVYLVENSGKRRVGQLKTTADGYFAFRNVDVSGYATIFTRMPNTITLLDVSHRKPIESFEEFAISKKVISVYNEEKTYNNSIEAEKIGTDTEKADTDIAVTKEIRVEHSELREDAILLDEAFLSDGRELAEVVVVSHGVSKKALSTGSITHVESEITETFNSLTSVLAGRMSGVEVTPRDIDAQKDKRIFIRGVSSMGSGNAGPAIVLDGILLSDHNSSVTDFLQSADIASIYVSKSPGDGVVNHSSNGVIYINTVKQPFRYKRYKQKYNGRLVNPKTSYNKDREFSQRIDNNDRLHTTVYWNGCVRTDKKGKAEINFFNNENSSSFRITAEGTSPVTGNLGSTWHKISTRKPFSVDVKTPLFASTGDTVRLPVMLSNNTENTVTPKVKLILPATFKPVGNQEITTSVPPNSARTIYLGFVPGIIKGEHSYTIEAELANTRQKESITRSINIRWIYFPQTTNISGRRMAADTSIVVPVNHVKGTLRAEAVCYTKTVDELFAGLESILREPYGCFEQASSSTFPNIMVLQAMSRSDNVNKKVRQRALKLLDAGYKRLISYEIKGGGFEWFGRGEAHTVLSAYGLLEFYEMSKVYDKVDPDMMKRTRNFILGRRSAKGGFDNAPGLYSFSGAPKSVSDAYIVYALTETGDTEIIKPEYLFALNEALKSKDMYRMALMANAASNMDDIESYRKLTSYFIEKIKRDGFDFGKLKPANSITRSGGKSLIQETAALWTLALLKRTDTEKMEIIDRCIEYLSSQRTPYGGFGNTQSTVLSLQALTYYSYQNVSATDGGILHLMVNNKPVTINLDDKPENDNRMAADLTSFITEGVNKISLRYSGVEKPLPYSINTFWEYPVPASSNECPLLLTTTLGNNSVKRNENVRLSITLENKSNTGLPMCIAIIGIPGGMSLQPWQLKELHEKEVFDFYEIIDDNLVIYYRSMRENERKEINLDLKAEVPGRYTGMASNTYVYYTNEHKYWLKGLEVEITE